LPTIFGLFTQVHSESAARHGGLGIGLALARSLVELHGGSISADSTGPGQGSEFTVRIPAPAISSKKTAEILKRSEDLAGIRVLVVDDNQDAADSIGLLIGDFGAAVRVAYDGAGALAALKEFDPSLVLLDIGLPDLNGYEACQQIRDIKGGAVSIVAVTVGDKMRIGVVPGMRALMRISPSPSILTSSRHSSPPRECGSRLRA
jgi:hypothetical protein